MKLRHPARRLAALALCLLLLLAFLPTAHAAEPDKTVTTAEELRTALENAPPEKNFTIQLTRNIEITDMLKIYDKTSPGPGAHPETRYITIIAADGVKLTASQDFHGGSMFDVGGHTRLTIDCEIEGNGRCSIVSATDSASLRLTPNADLHGGSSGVSVYGAAKFSMTGGSVHDNSGTGISVNSGGSIQISGGSIENNGTGVYVGSNSNLSLKGGTFTGNTNDVVIGAPTIVGTPQTPSVTIGTGSTVTANIRIEGHQNPPWGIPEKTMLTIGHDATLNGNVTVGGFQINNAPPPNVQNEGTINGDVSLDTNAKLDNSNGTINGVVVTGNKNMVTEGNGTITGGIVEPTRTYTITASAGENGKIDPSGAYEVTVLHDQPFTIKANEGYAIDTVKVDGSPVPVDSESQYTYTFTSVADNHTIEATFKLPEPEPEPEPEQPSAPESSFTEPSYYPDYDEEAPAEEEQPEEEEAPLYMVTCRTLNVRLGGGTGYARIGTLSRGTILEGELEDGWLKFPYNGQTAYCSADYLARVDGDLSGLHVTCRTLNVRAGAGTNFEILGTLSRGTEVEILDVLNGWYEIEYLGGEAYVSAAYIG